MPAPALSVIDLALSGGGHRLVHPLTLLVEAAECVALLGASGWGKSLTASALSGSVPDGITASGKIPFSAGPGPVTHCLATAAGMRGTTAVLSQGRIVEHAPTDQVLANPASPPAVALEQASAGVQLPHAGPAAAR